MKNFSVVQISSFSDIRGLLVDLKASDRHHIPLCKILFSLERKGFLNTIVVDHAATCGQFNAECEIIGEQPAKVVRLHFFGKAPQVDKHSYAGYCDVRPGGTIADAFITTKTVRNRETDSYAFIPSVVKCHLEFPLPEDPSKTGRATLYGFHYIEKNCRETMCAQAALIGVVRYWQSKDKALFPDIKSTIDINRLAGVSEDEQKSAKPRGLSPEEIGKFLVSQGMLYVCNNYTGVSRGRLKREKLLETIYGFIESGFPVILAIKTDDALHAITIIGHTFDKNSWQAMADVGYFSMTPRFEAYHPNVTWVENLIIQDDNFGPYYFLKTHMLEDLIAAMIVPLPYGPVILPYEATNAAATKTIYSKGFISGVKNIITSQKFLKQNAMWFDEFASHLVRTCGDGLVLRPVLRTRSDIYSAYEGHEFATPMQSLFKNVGDTELFWMIELSWPDIYCFGQATCGMLLFHSLNKDLSQMLVHLPGILMLLNDKNPGPAQFIIAKNEDAPRQHVMPGKNA